MPGSGSSPGAATWIIMNCNDSSFVPFDKIPRLFRECIITEKIDGTNAQILIHDVEEDNGIAPPGIPWLARIGPEGRRLVAAGSRTRYLFLDQDNYGFARWVLEHADELATLGPGRHFGEWWGSGINRGYDARERQFSLFNVSRWHREIFTRNEARRLGREANKKDVEVTLREFAPPPACCCVVPVLCRGEFNTHVIRVALDELALFGSRAKPGFMRPEGVVIFHEASQALFKVTLENDGKPKSA